MLFQGLIWVCAFILPTACSSEEYYAVSHPPLSTNLTCERDNRVFEPCGTLERLNDALHSFQGNFVSIYLLDSEYTLSRDIHLEFSSLDIVQIRAGIKSTTSFIMCSNHDFSAHFINIGKIIIESVGFHDCGKSKRRRGTIELNTKLGFIRNTIIKRNELQVTSCIFYKGNVFIESDVSNATFKNVSFNHNEVSSIKYSGYVTGNLVISDCTFYNSKTNDSVIKVSMLNSVAITYSFFNDNSVGSILSSQETDEIIIADCYIVSNIVAFNTISTISSGSYSSGSIPSASFFDISNTIAFNNTNEASMLFIQDFQSINIFNCSFTRNMGGSSLKDCSDIVINQTTFEGNRKSAITLWNYRNILTVYNCKFLYNIAEDSGAAINSQVNKPLTIQRCVFISNQAEIDGGAVQARSNEIEVMDSQFLNNSALIGDGGAIWNSGNLFVTSSSFSFNRATRGGALFMAQAINFAKINNSQFIQNVATEGGGAVVILTKLTKLILFHNCSFQENIVLSPDGKGGAINVVSSIWLIVNHTNFTANSGNYGGGLNIKDTQNVVVWDCYFKHNTAKRSGGAVLMTNDNSAAYLYAYSKFINNFAKHGGALAFVFNGVFSTLTYSCINETANWLEYSIEEPFLYFPQHYSGNISSSLSNFNVTVITNCSFSKNEANRREQGRGGAISLQGHFHAEPFPKRPVIDKCNAVRLFLRHCTFDGNSAAIGGGIYCNTSILIIETTDFQQNSAQLYGGGISSEHTWVCLEGKVDFISNFIISDSGKGGAIYSENKCEVNLCPLLWTNQTSLNFAGNSAAHGSMLYGGMLDRCDNLPGQSLKSALKMLTSDIDRYRRSLDVISSPATNFCFKGNCSIRTRREVLYPGQSFNVTVGCLDQLKQPLNSCLIQSQYLSTDFLLGSGENKRIINGYDDVAFQLNSNRKGAAMLTISSNISCIDDMWKNLVVTIDVGSCPLCFQLQNKRCDCDSRLLRTSLNLECSINEEVIILTESESGWLSIKDGLLRTHLDCPPDYCLQTRKYISPLLPDVQCANNRGGVLCGGCLANYSAVLGSWKCMECSHSSSYNFIWLSVVMALAGLVLVVFLLLVKMTVSSGTVNGLIFYANIMSFSGLLVNQKCNIYPFLHLFISWINLDLGIEVCFYPGMDVYQKTWLQFVFPFYIFFLVGVIILVCHYSSTVMKLMGMRNIEVLATPFLLSYAKLLKTIVTALSVTNIMVARADNITDPLRPHKVWFYDGNIDYFGSKHLPLFIVAFLFLLFLFMPYTLFLLCGQWLQYMPRKRGFRWIHSTFLSTIMDAYHAPYTKHHRYWTGLGLLIRCYLFIIFGTNYSTGINLISISITVTILLVIRIASSGKLYRNKVVGLLELFYLSNLGILATLLLINDTLCDAITVSISLSFVMFVGILFYHLHYETKGKNFSKMITKKFNKIFETKCSTSEKKEKNVIPGHGSTTSSYFQLRESLIDST